MLECPSTERMGEFVSAQMAISVLSFTNSETRDGSML